jgi:hypothetical protein
MLEIPINYIDFLYWVKDTTERFWLMNKINSEIENVYCEDWIYGAKWLGLADNKITEIEKKFNLTFSEEHKSFLRILHIVDKKPDENYFIENEDSTYKYHNSVCFLFNWLQDDKIIWESLNRPYNDLLFDVLGINSVWLKSWNEKPNNEEDRIEKFRLWYQAAPQLLPLTGRHYKISDTNKQNPIISMHGSDMLVSAWNFRQFILQELSDNLNISTLLYDKEDEIFYSEITIELTNKINKEEFIKAEKKIECWEEMINYWNKNWGWSTFEYLNEKHL